VTPGAQCFINSIVMCFLDMLNRRFNYFLFLSVLWIPLQVTGGYLYAGDADASVIESSDMLSPEERTNDRHHDEEEWYQTFWEGTVFTDGWHDITEDILISMPEVQRAGYKEYLRELGEKIGREWAKDNEVRRIDNSKLMEWGDRLKGTAADEPAALVEVIRNINNEVESILD